MGTGAASHGIVGHAGSIGRTPSDVFNEIYVVFLGLGTLVGVIVIGYTVYNAVKYRDNGEEEEEPPEKVVRPELGEIPESSGGGKKLFVSFLFSAIIVVSLILWTYSALLYVDEGAAKKTDGNGATDIGGVNADGVLVVDVIGQRFSWIFVYPNGHRTTTLRVPENVPVKLNVTSQDVMHNIGIPAFNAKTDAVPGQTTSAWFVPDRQGTFTAACYELCGSGHSVMQSDVVVTGESDYQNWYEGLEESTNNETNATAGNSTDDSGQQNALETSARGPALTRSAPQAPGQPQARPAGGEA